MIVKRVIVNERVWTFFLIFISLHCWIFADKMDCISGDHQSYIHLNHRFKVTVGQDASADFQGTTHKVIQSAIDYVSRYGGGIVYVLPGVYTFSNAVYLSSHIDIVGSGSSTVFVKSASVETELLQDSDWYQQCIAVNTPERFKVGDGICIKTKNPHHGGTEIIKRTIIAIDGNKLILDKALRENIWLGQETTIATLFPLISGEFVEDITIENLILDGNKNGNLNLDGNYAGCIWLQDCKNITIRNVETRNYNGDGISWQIVHDIVIENCYSHDNTGLGLHPGSGSQRTKMTNNRIENNDIGIFFCWGVQDGIAENNHLENNRIGISIGHLDNYNIIRKNRIVSCKEYGIVFREETDRFPALGNKIQDNIIENIQSENGAGIYIKGHTQGNEIQNNSIKDKISQGNKAGIKIVREAKENIIKDNEITGFKRDIVIE